MVTAIAIKKLKSERFYNRDEVIQFLGAMTEEEYDSAKIIQPEGQGVDSKFTVVYRG